MSNQKGFTLIEVLGAAALLAIAILGVTYLLQQTTLFSKQNESAGDSIQITRTLLEEIKNNLKSGDTVMVYGQAVDLKAIRDNAAPYSPPPVFFPDAGRPSYRLDISSVDVTNSNLTPSNGPAVDLKEYFRLIRIVATHVSDNRTYQVETYAEIK